MTRKRRLLLEPRTGVTHLEIFSGSPYPTTYCDEIFEPENVRNVGERGFITCFLCLRYFHMHWGLHEAPTG